MFRGIVCDPPYDVEEKHVLYVMEIVLSVRLRATKRGFDGTPSS